MQEILKMVQCPRKCYLSKQKLPNKKSKGYDSMAALRKLLAKEPLANWDDPQTIEAYFAEVPCVLQREKERELNVMRFVLARFVRYFKNAGFVLVEQSHWVTAQVAGVDLKGCFDLIYKDLLGVTHAAFISKHPTVGRMSSAGNYIGKSLKYQLAYRLAEADFNTTDFVVEEIALMSNDENGISLPENMRADYQEKKLNIHFDKKDVNLKSLRVDSSTLLPEDETCEDVLKRCSKMLIDRNAEKNTQHCQDCRYAALCGFIQQKKKDPNLVEEVYKDRSNVRFSQSQEKVINFEKGICRVLAGAGSGKTTTLVSRVINLLQVEDCEPKDFLLITFTDKGCLELKEKLDSFMKTNSIDLDVNEFNIHTFNSYGAQIISENYEYLGFSKPPVLIDQLVVYDMILKMLDQHPIIPGYNYQNPLLDFYKAQGIVVKLAALFKELKAKNIDALIEMQEAIEANRYGIRIKAGKGKIGQPNYVPSEYTFDYALFFNLYKEYCRLCAENAFIDYDDQIHLALKCLKEPSIRRKYVYKHIMIDEYQDTSKSQFALIQQLEKNFELISLLVCGDDAQGIFGFRGVSIDNILNFPYDYPGANLFTLDDNFRSTEQIVEVSNNLLNFSSCGLKKKVIAHKSGKPVTYINNAAAFGSNRFEECVKLIKKEIEEGTKEEEIAILSRTHKNLNLIADALRRKQIDYMFAVSEPLIENQTVIAIRGLLNFMMEPTLSGELISYLMTVKYDEFNRAEYLDDFVAVEAELLAEELNVMDAQQKMDFLLNTIKNINVDRRAMNVLLDEFERQKITDVEHACRYVNKLFDYNSDLEVPKDDRRFQAVTLTTVHAAKGREFKKVFILLDGFKLPEVLFEDKVPSSFDEELRLLYVAITRAEEECTLIEDGEKFKVYFETLQ